ncbi:MAG TPA: HAMP domain-containing histidine kinase [Actinobacteria bacterium]|nr:HAMP domain-containing histidine kinase [Actinomycetota bacterium]
MRINRLWQKMAIGFVAVAVASIIVLFALVNFVVDTQFQGYIGERERASYRRIGQSIATFYLKNGGWDGRLMESLPHVSTLSGVAIEVVDANGAVVAEAVDTKRQDTFIENIAKAVGSGQFIKDRFANRVEVPMLDGDRKVGSVYITPLVKPGELEEDMAFRKSLNNSLLFGGVLAALVALTLSFIISARLTSPLAQITKAARKMEEGNLGYRVNIKEKDEIGKLGDAFNNMSMALQAHERLRKNMTADVAHELRTPLATIRSHLEAYLDGVMEPDEKNLQSIHEETLRLGRLVDDLSELAQVESGKLNLNKKKIDLVLLTKQTISSMEPMIEQKELTFDLKSNGQIIGDFDEDRIKQVLVNLIANATKFTPTGGRVTVEISSEKDKALVSITDTGTGIDSESLPYIFDRFYRVDKSRNRATGGSGIGLTIAREITKLHGGSINVTSKMGVGSTFTICLPRNSGKKRKSTKPT